MENDPRKPQTLALAPVLIFALVLAAVFGAALITTFDRSPMVVTATDTAPPGTTGLAKSRPTTERR
ncbi:MAG: hypothetical protein G4V63_14010 [Candidatus Afipia apatlaquensis]|uniref:Uncharacterized protein n=1 Tax=Candidatus Afipia apatlaquensis TaxID=2712852 RepID=A0A7C9RGH3_9BRAD|nr:hypothetical protein [Candidatus Afipia apatlaquensis]